MFFQEGDKVLLSWNYIKNYTDERFRKAYDKQGFAAIVFFDGNRHGLTEYLKFKIPDGVESYMTGFVLKTDVYKITYLEEEVRNKSLNDRILMFQESFKE